MSIWKIFKTNKKVSL